MNLLYENLTRIMFLYPNFRRMVISFAGTALVTLSMIFLFTSDRIVTGPVGWERLMIISPRETTVKNIRTAVRGNLVMAAYEGTENGKQGLFTVASFDGGASFGPPVKIADINSAIEANPWIALSPAGSVMVFWQNLEAGASSTRIFFTSSGDFGLTWEKPGELKLGFDAEILPRAFYDSRETLHLFFHAYRDGAFNLFHAVKNSKGVFEVRDIVVRMTENMKGAFFPSIAQDGSRFFLVWQGKLSQAQGLTDDLFFVSSGNYGGSWSSPQKITTSTADDSTPFLLIKNGIFYVAYQNNDSGNWRVKIITSIDGGKKWSEKPLEVSTSNLDAFRPTLAAVGNDILATWYDARERNTDIYTRKLIVRDNKFDDEQKISQGNGNARNPQPLFTGTRGIVLWEDSGRVVARAWDLYAPPPVVFSATHPADQWSRNNRAEISWNEPRDESGIVGYATILNKIPDFNPGIQNRTANVTREVLPDLDDGVTWFHIRSIDGAGNFSRTVHYPIQVSKNPLPIPVVVSASHPEGKIVKETRARFQWSLDDLVRLKGFVYSMSRDRLVKPESFTRSFEQIFTLAEEGSYFFSIAAIDKTNQLSETAVYRFIVGKASEGVEIKPVDDKIVIPFVDRTPSISLNLPVKDGEAWDRQNMDVLVALKNIDPESVAGYAVKLGQGETDLPLRINHRSGVLRFEGLKNGPYTLKVACRYLPKGNDAGPRWTEPASARFAVRLAPPSSPLLRLLERQFGVSTGKMLVSGGVMFLAVIFLFGALWRVRFRFIFEQVRFRWAALRAKPLPLLSSDENYGTL